MIWIGTVPSFGVTGATIGGVIIATGAIGLITGTPDTSIAIRGGVPGSRVPEGPVHRTGKVIAGAMIPIGLRICPAHLVLIAIVGGNTQIVRPG